MTIIKSIISFLGIKNDIIMMYWSIKVKSKILMCGNKAKIYI